MIPRIVVAGTRSGCGKTTIASGIMAALTRRGMTVQPYKVGPDFIDPSHHTALCGRSCRNLDPYMMGETGVIRTFERSGEGADIAVIEGVMGLYDGIDGTDTASTAHVARLLDAPVLLVVDVQGSSRSANALISGFKNFDPGISIGGVILNRVGSVRHRRMIERSLPIPSWGWIPTKEEIRIRSRHLGLVMASETGSASAAGDICEEFCDLDAIVACASRSSPSSSGRTSPVRPGIRPSRTTIGVAWDDAFCFYYPDNLDRLRQFGADLVFFSPMNEPLPPADALYFGGGYPELHLAELEGSESTRALGSRVDSGMPVYAECGGLMFLARSVAADRIYRLCGVLPADAEMMPRKQALGYVKGESTGRSFIPRSLRLTGHEFHYSRIMADRDAIYAYRLSRGTGIEDGKDGLVSHNAVGSYTHAYFSDRFARSFVDAAYHFSKSQGRG